MKETEKVLHRSSTCSAIVVVVPAQPAARRWEARLTYLLSVLASTSIVLENMVNGVRLYAGNVPYKLLVLMGYLWIQAFTQPPGLHLGAPFQHLACLLFLLLLYTGVFGYSCIRARNALEAFIQWQAFTRYAACQRPLQATQQIYHVSLSLAHREEPLTYTISHSSLLLRSRTVSEESGESHTEAPTDMSAARVASKHEVSVQEEASTPPVKQVFIYLFGELAIWLEGMDGTRVAVPLHNTKQQALFAYMATHARTQWVEHDVILTQAGKQDSVDPQGWFNKNMGRIRTVFNDVAQSAGWSPINPFLHEKQDHSFWRLSDQCTCPDLNTFLQLCNAIAQGQQDGGKPGNIRWAGIGLIKLYTRGGYLAKQIDEEAFRPWAMKSFLHYHQMYLKALQQAAKHEYTMGQQQDGEQQRACFKYAALFLKRYAYGASKSLANVQARRGEQALQQCLQMYELAKEQHLADQTYRGYSTWMKRRYPEWTPLPETIKVWKHAIGE